MLPKIIIWPEPDKKGVVRDRREDCPYGFIPQSEGEFWPQECVAPMVSSDIDLICSKENCPMISKKAVVVW